MLRDSSGDYFLRVGPGGVVLRMPQGLDLAQAGFGSKVVSLALRWEEIHHLTVTSQKQLGSLSRNAGNIGSSIHLRLTSGKKYCFDTSMLSLPGYLIHQRIEEAREMVVSDVGFDSGIDEVPEPVQVAYEQDPSVS